MNYVFVDNYRGFAECIIPIEAVNFLVGENSTGKSSILGLLSLLSPAESWFSNELDIRRVGFGTFRDVVSVAAEDKSFFTIGVLFDAARRRAARRASEKTQPQNTSESSEWTPMAFAMIFKEHDGMPKLDSFISYRDGYEVKVRYMGDQVRFKHRKVDHGQTAEEFSTHFAGWVREFRGDKSGYTRLKESSQFLRAAPPIVALSFVEDKIREENGGKAKFHFEVASFFQDMAWLAPIRSKPRKTYDEFSLEYSPEGDHTPYLIKKTLDSKTEAGPFKKFLRSIGGDSGLFRDVQIKNYGRSMASPFELDVVLGEHPLSVSNVGYGISQSLPVIVEMFSKGPGSWLAIQQPEVHVHPRAQAAFGSSVFDLAVDDGKKFLIETHSDYLIDRYRVSMRKSDKKISSQVLFFERTKVGNTVTPIAIGSDGGMSSEQPATYREFFIREELEVLGL